MEFLVKHDEYFSTHAANKLPLEFIYRLGELLESEYSNFVSNTLRHVEQVLDEAKEFVWLASDQPLISEKSILEYCDKKTNISVKILIKKNSEKYSLLKQKLGSRFETKYVENLTAGMALNEKIAGVVFNDKRGALDFNSGFVAKSPKSYKWCYDLFMHNWNS
jgi:predicted transcriptional regulator